MKAYTDIEQSKKLAEILPLESADMKWYFWKSEIDAPKLPTFGYDKDTAENCKNTEVVYLPCWSLAALLEALPRVYKLKPLLDLEENSIMYSGTYIDVTADNLVDACVKMLLKLNTKVNSL